MNSAVISSAVKHAVFALICATMLLGCRGGISTSPPVHLIPDMDHQPKLKAQSKSEFFSDSRGMRLPVEGTVARGSLRTGSLYVHQTPSGDWVTQNPLPPSMEVLNRGQERYDIHCSACHGYAGRGGNQAGATSTVGRYWRVAIPSFIDDERVSQIPDGEIFEVITNSRNTMPSYKHQVSVEDRWAIIHYIRALQYQAQNQ